MAVPRYVFDGVLKAAEGI